MTTVRGSSLVRVIEAAWSRLQRQIVGLPNVVVVVLSGRRAPYGHFGAARWQRLGKAGVTGELGVNPALFHSPHAVLEVLLHEAAHALLSSRGIKDVRDYYHRKSFRDVCVKELDLDCEFRNPRFGWTSTSLPAFRATRYAEVLQELKRLRWGHTARPLLRTSQPLPKSGYLTLSCDCKPARRIRCTEKTLAKGAIACVSCGAAFHEANLRRRQAEN
jgi:hypothetical protein